MPFVSSEMQSNLLLEDEKTFILSGHFLTRIWLFDRRTWLQCILFCAKMAEGLYCKEEIVLEPGNLEQVSMKIVGDAE